MNIAFAVIKFITCQIFIIIFLLCFFAIIKVKKITDKIFFVILLIYTFYIAVWMFKDDIMTSIGYKLLFGW